MNIQTIKKDKILSKNFSIIDIIFNNSFIKSLINNNFKDSFNIFKIYFD